MNAIHITAGGSVSVVEIREGDEQLADLQAKVGGYIEVVPLTPTIALICDEEGKLKARPINHIANRLVRHVGVELLDGDHLVGDVVIVGSDDSDTVDVLAGLVGLIASL